MLLQVAGLSLSRRASSPPSSRLSSGGVGTGERDLARMIWLSGGVVASWLEPIERGRKDFGKLTGWELSSMVNACMHQFHATG
jgi:hypothetical protein